MAAPPPASDPAAPAARLDMDITASLSSRSGPFTLRAAFAVSASRVALFGPSGSGKSLTLRALAGLLRPEAGVIRVDGRALFDAARGLDLPTRERRVGFVFQDYALFPHLTVRQNVAFGLRPGLGRPSALERERVEAVVEQFGLAAVADSRPGRISGGQRQRAALARAVISGPRLLLLDEPFSALDLPLRRRVRTEVRDLLDRLDIPVVMVSHDPEDLTGFAEVVVPYHQGRSGRAMDAGEVTRESVEALFAEAART